MLSRSSVEENPTLLNTSDEPLVLNLTSGFGDEKDNLIKTKNDPSELTKIELLTRSSLTALPIIGINLLDTLNSFATGLILARVSPAALAASPLIDALELTLVTVSTSPLHAAGMSIREAKGAGKNSKIGSIWRQSLIIGVSTAIPTMILMRFATAPILNLLRQPKDIITAVQSFFDAYIWYVLPNNMLSCIEQFAFGIDEQKLVIALRILDLAVFTLPAYALTFGKLGAPELGAAGLGYAFCIQGWVSLIASSSWLYFRDSQFGSYELFNFKTNHNFNYLKKMLKIGLPMSLSAINELSSGFFITSMIGKLGKKALSVQAVAYTYNTLLVLEPSFSIARSTSLLVSEAVGSKNIHNLRGYGDTGIFLGSVVSVLGLSIFAIFPELLTASFMDLDTSSDHGILELVKVVLLMTGLSQCIDTVRNISFGALSGMADTLIPSIISTVTTWLIGIPILLFGFIFRL